MNKNHLVSGVVAAVMLLSPAAVLAEENTSGSGDTTKPETTTTQQSEADKAAELKKRIEENKAKLKSKVDEAAKKRIAAKCKPAQNLVRGAETSATAVTENRSKAYAKISERVQALITKLKAANIDTTELEKVQKTAKEKADALGVSMKAYQQTLADLQAMDCAADPTAFAATLETARTQRQTIKTQATELRTYISTTLKQAIQKVKTELEKQKETTSTTGTESATGGNQ